MYLDIAKKYTDWHLDNMLLGEADYMLLELQKQHMEELELDHLVEVEPVQLVKVVEPVLEKQEVAPDMHMGQQLELAFAFHIARRIEHTKQHIAVDIPAIVDIAQTSFDFHKQH